MNDLTTLPRDVLDPRLINVRRCSLRVTSGPSAGQQLGPLGERTLVGREAWCDVPLEDRRVSGQHCEVLVDRDAVRVRDLGSRNGTWCNGARVVDAYLEPGIVLRVGDSELALEAGAGRTALQVEPWDPTGKLLGTSRGMRTLFRMMSRVAPLEISVLLLGETGTGKTAVARALHEMSPRSGGAFVAVNCGALPADLVESTLFGHVKGAFTGAHREVKGVFEQADGGTLLLDEIGEMPLGLQPKLLQVLEGGMVRPVGAERARPVDVRVFAATHRPLQRMIAEGHFRKDLYYRIAGIELPLPPLRERPGDVAPLARLMLGRHLQRAGTPPRELTPSALQRLASHTWPGNLRELDNVMARAVALSDGAHIDGAAVLVHGAHGDEGYGPSHAVCPGTVAHTNADLDQPFKDFKAQLLAREERAYLERLLERADGNVSKAARLAGISRTHVTNLLQRHGLKG